MRCKCKDVNIKIVSDNMDEKLCLKLEIGAFF